MSFSAVDQVTGKILKLSYFYPELSVKKMAEETRLDGTVTTARLESNLRHAHRKIARELAEWERQCEFATLKEYDAFTEQAYLSAKAKGKPVIEPDKKCELYEMAVFNETRAMLTEQYRDFDSTPNKTQRLNEVQPAIDEYRRNVRNAITMFFDGFTPQKKAEYSENSGFMTVDLI